MNKEEIKGIHVQEVQVQLSILFLSYFSSISGLQQQDIYFIPNMEDCGSMKQRIYIFFMCHVAFREVLHISMLWK